MADLTELPEGALPPLSPTSERIQRHAAQMGVARLLGVVGAAPIETLRTFIDTTPRPLEQIDPAVLAPPERADRPIERPREVDDWLAVSTPQFFLRNTWRACREANPEKMEFERSRRDEIRPVDPHETVRAALSRPSVRVRLARHAVHSYLAERAALMIEPWRDRFGRPDP